MQLLYLSWRVVLRYFIFVFFIVVIIVYLCAFKCPSLLTVPVNHGVHVVRGEEINLGRPIPLTFI